MNFKELISALSQINEQLRDQNRRAVNVSLTLCNWFFGFYIFGFEQNGREKTGYGKTLLANIAAEMKALGVPNTDERELRRCRQFYLPYPAASKLLDANSPIRELLTPESNIPDPHYFNLFSGVSYAHYQKHVEFATAGIDDKVFVAKYSVALPDKKELEKFIKKELKDNWQQHDNVE